MCGIAGLIGKSEVVTRERLERIAESLVHRGPDDGGIEVLATPPHRTVGFVHRRLAIIDPSPSGHQPMADPLTGNWIAFNGEIYNYRQLRGEIERGGARFRTNTDTEVILAAYAAWGPACVERFAGMFAFALWDDRSQSLLLVTDRFGIKPLYYWHDGQRFAFASEIRALLASDVLPRTLDHSAVASFFAFGSITAPQTILADVRQLLPGHRLVLDGRTGIATVERYWRPPPVGAAAATEADVHAALVAAVERHLVSDVPVGLFLSGGIDSSALAVLAHRAGVGNALTAFTVTFPERAYAEGPYARHIGERFCGAYREIELRDADLEAFLPASLDAMDQPSIDGTNVYVLSRAVREAGVKTVLSGQGADELFGGYPTFRQLPAFHAARQTLRVVPRAVRFGVAAGILAGAPLRSVAAKAAALLESDLGVTAAYAVSRQLFHVAVRNRLLHQSGAPACSAETRAWWAADLDGRDPFHATSMLERKGYLANTLLRDSDVFAMAHGLEIRVPYLDHELVETVSRVPAERCRDPMLPKPLLLRAVADDLPTAAYLRPKMGFTFPWEEWLRGRLAPLVTETIATFPTENALGVNVAECRLLWERFLGRRSGITWSRAWAPFVAMRWARKNGFA